MAINYRPEIDGLRTIAVLSVIIYHAEFAVAGSLFLPGGYLGVDIFFVISGYLITFLILKELRGTGHFSVLNFYERRARRLLPALLLVMGAASIAAWKILLPAQLVDFAYSQLASLFFVSNFYWDFSLQIYGAQPALLKPLLHTWSLAVEEQYYILFPLLLMLVFRYARHYLVILLCIGLLASLFFAQWYTSVDANSSFYLLLSRFWELLAGGLLACLVVDGALFHERKAIDTVAPIAGLVLVIASFLLFDHDTHHPGLITLIPVFGTMLIIAYTGRHDPVTRLLSSRVFVAIGLISYSLYLWHFPIFAFARNLHTDIGSQEKLVWVALTFAGATFSYFAVEKPFRNRKFMSTGRAMALIASALLCVVIFSSYAVLKNGVRERHLDLEVLYGLNEFDNAVLKRRSWSILDGLAAEQGLGRSFPLRPSEFEATRLWFSDRLDTEKVLIAGVSTSRCLFNALYLNRDSFHSFEFARFGMHRDVTQEHITALFSSPNFKAADTLMLNFAVKRGNIAAYSSLVEQVVAAGKRVLIVSNPQQFIMRNDTPPFDWHLLKRRVDGSAPLDFKQIFYADRLLAGVDMNPDLAVLAALHKLKFLNLSELVCDASMQQCDGVTPDGYKAYYDGVHWTLEGAKFFGSRMAQRGWLEPQ